MITEQSIEKAINELFDNLDFSAEPRGLYDPLRYMISIGGKRIRPRLCLLTYSLFQDEFNESILSSAAALEVFHSFTLIHDDIMDNASVRRGVPTVWKKWDGNTAILSGDVMCIESYRLLSKAPTNSLPAILKLFSDTAAEVCEGQQYDMEFEMKDSVSMDEYLRMIGLKTAVLIACSAKVGALIGGANEKTADLLYKFAHTLGIAFQIVDDYLDTFGDTKVFGKTIGGDILNNKKTWLLTKAFEKLSFSGEQTSRGSTSCEGLRLQLLDALNMPINTDEQKQKKIDSVKQLFISLNIEEDAIATINSLHRQAMGYISELGLSRIKTEMLQRYADKLLVRKK